MHAWLSKPLDWMAIQLASRGFTSPQEETCPVGSLAELAPAHDFDTKVRLEEAALQLAPDDTLQFRSPVRSASAQNNFVRGRLYRSAPNWERRPTVILLHGWNAELCYRYLFPHLASHLGRARVNTVIFELPYHMHRRPRLGPVRDFISTDLRAMLEATRQAIADVRVLCRWLESVGSNAIGLWGFSLGAWLTGLIARLEPNLSFAVLTTPIVRLDRAIAELPFCAPVRQSLRRQSVDLGDLNLAAQLPRLRTERILLQQSRHDLFAPLATVEELWEGWGRPEIWRLAQGHISILLSRRIMLRTVEWIRCHSE